MAHQSRLVTLCCALLLGAFAGPALAQCAGWSASALDRHACCAGRGELASEASVTNCCAASEQSNGVGPTESVAAGPPLKLLQADFPAGANLCVSSRIQVPGASSGSRRTFVPPYLQQVSLLI